MVYVEARRNAEETGCLASVATLAIVPSHALLEQGGFLHRRSEPQVCVPASWVHSQTLAGHRTGCVSRVPPTCGVLSLWMQN